MGISDKFTTIKGFTRAESVTDLFLCDYVILSMPTGRDVLDILSHYDKHSVILDTTTISLGELQEIRAALGRKEANYLSWKLEMAPKEANEGKLAIFVGGERKLYEKTESVLKILGDYMYLGNHEQASMMNLISNMVRTAVVDIFGEISVLIRKLETDPESAALALSMGGASSVTQMFQLDWQSRDTFGESLSLELAQHVMEMALESARNAGVSNMPLIDQNNLLMKLARTMGIGKKDVSEISKIYWNLNNIK